LCRRHDAADSVSGELLDYAFGQAPPPSARL
jgi:hypothetical protein